jgi:hypothetical protein
LAIIFPGWIFLPARAQQPRHFTAAKRGRSAVVQLDERRGIEEEGKSQTAKSPL